MSNSGVLRATVTGILVVAAGFAGFAVGAARTPPDLRTDTPPAVFPVVLEPFDDPRQVTVVPVPGPATTIAARRSGTLTRSACRVGDRVVSGSAPWAVDGRPVLALATAEPPYRDLGPGVRGTDVESLQGELVRLGYEVAVDGVYGPQTGRAVAGLREANGLAVGTSLPLVDVAWLPETEPVMAACAPLGAVIPVGGALGESRPTLLGARVDPLPTDLVPGGRTLQVDDQSFPVDGAGEVAAVDLPALAALPITAAALETMDRATEVPLSGTLALTEPLTTATVPASAVLHTGSQACVAAGGTTTPVRVVSSTFGQAVVSFEDGVPPEQVDVEPEASLSCG